MGAQSLYGNASKDMIYRFQRVSPMEVSPHDPSVLYYGSQVVHRTRDEGVTWETISPDLTTNDADKKKGNVPHCTITTIAGDGREGYSGDGAPAATACAKAAATSAVSKAISNTGRPGCGRAGDLPSFSIRASDEKASSVAPVSRSP